MRILPVTLFMKLVASKFVRKPPVILKIVLKAGHESWICIGIGERTVERGGKPEQRIDAAFGTILNLWN